MDVTVALDDSWRAWLHENIERGCSHETMVAAMVGDGFDPEAAATAVRTMLSGELPTESAYRYDPWPVADGRVVQAYDREVYSLLRLERPQVILFDNVLSAAECDEVIALSEGKLQPSTVVDPDTGQPAIVAHRSSANTSFRISETPLIDRLDRRLSALMNWPLENGEGLQILRYGVGEEFRSHFDYFPPDQPGHTTQIAVGGQRTATLIVYLNDVAAGGETVFADAGVTVSPRRGQAVYFRYFNARGQLDPATKHAGAPVLSGEKWIMTKWMRRYRFP